MSSKQTYSLYLLVIIAVFILIMTPMIAAISGGQFNYHDPTKTCVLERDKGLYNCGNPDTYTK